MTRRKSSRRRGRRRAQPWWVDLPTDDLLSVRLCDLELEIEGSPLEPRIIRLEDDLARAGLRFRPKIWLSTDWFSPEGVAGFALPFFLAHPKLARLERQHMLQVEGGNHRWCLQLLRHETGHAIDSAYRLRRRRRWREKFGRAGRPYRASYVPNPDSRRFVHHLPDFYAQSHPCEDFAETFAVWVGPGARWRSLYAGWPALRKLEYVDELMSEIAERVPAARSRERTDSLSTLRMTLRDYYLRKEEHYGREDLTVYDHELGRLFSDDAAHRRRKSAAAFLRERRNELVRVVARWTGQHRYTVDEVLRGMILRARDRRLRLAASERETAEGAAVVAALHAAEIERMRHREYFR